MSAGPKSEGSGRESETLRFQALVTLAESIRAAADADKMTPQQWMLMACREKLDRQQGSASAPAQRMAS